MITGSAALTYAVGLWIVLDNPFLFRLIYHPPITWEDVTPVGDWIVTFLVIVLGHTPVECLVRIGVTALVIQSLTAFTVDGPEIDMERYRPYVFWRALYRFAAGCAPFLSGRRLNGPPSTSLTEYERVTIRYFFAKLIFMPMMIGFFFGNLQSVISEIGIYSGPHSFTVPYLQYVYLLAFRILILVDVAWFAIGCSLETERFSPVKMVDPYASGWIVTLACYPPFVMLTGQLVVWGSPEFPRLFHPCGALFYMGAGLVLYTIYVFADFCFGLKTGNLLYRGLVDKGPYRWVRHPMYATKNTAWFLFTLPGLNFHLGSSLLVLGAWRVTCPILFANWGIVWPMLAWMSIYAMRGLTEERYLLAYSEYREYCKRVRYRFIPGVF